MSKKQEPDPNKITPNLFIDESALNTVYKIPSKN